MGLLEECHKKLGEPRERHSVAVDGLPGQGAPAQARVRRCGSGGARGRATGPPLGPPGRAPAREERARSARGCARGTQGNLQALEALAARERICPPPLVLSGHAASLTPY
jgi:hypothetical protein